MSIQRVEETLYAQATGVEGCGVVVWCGVVWFGKYTEIAFLVSLFGFTQPIHILAAGIVQRVLE